MRFFYLPFIVVLLVSGLTAAQPAPEKQTAPPMRFDQANAIVKFDCTFVALPADGKAETTRHYQIAVLSDRAIRENAQDVTVYNVGYDTVEIVTARVHLPDGQIVDVPSESIKDVPMPAFGKFFLQNVREKIITFPELTQGAEIEVSYREITREPPMEGEFDLFEQVQHTDPVQQKYVEIVAPKEVDLHWKTRSGTLPYERVAVGDKVKHVWLVRDIPQLVPEPGMPPMPEVMSQLLVTTVDDWQTWSRWYSRLSEPEMVATDEIRQAVRELTEGKTLPEDKVREIFYFVSNHIRYVETALTGRKAGYKPESADVTFRNKYGVCRDKAALMVTMLREAGISSDIVLMNPSWKIDGGIPVDQFNHAIVAVHQGDSTYFVDPTVEKTKDFLAANEQDRGVLQCTAAGKDLEWTPVEPSEQNLYQIRAESHLREDGSFDSKVTISTRGFPDLILRNYLQSMPPEERMNLFKQIAQTISASAVLDSLSISDPMDFSQTVGITMHLHAADYSIPAEPYLLFQVPAQSSGLDFLTRYFLRGSELMVRRYDLRLPSTFAVRAEETVSFPEGYRIRSLPDPVNQDFGSFRMARQFDVKGNHVTVKRVMDFSTLTVPLDQYDKLQELMRKNEAMSRGQVVLVKA